MTAVRAAALTGNPDKVKTLVLEWNQDADPTILKMVPQKHWLSLRTAWGVTYTGPNKFSSEPIQELSKGAPFLEAGC